MPTISLCMIAKDEEKNIGTVLECAKKFADEIIVVDTGSSDRTPEIAKEFGAKVYHFQWCDDFSAARNESLKYATGDWIMWLDADDYIDEENIKRIIELKKNLPKSRDEAYYFIIESKISEGDETSWYWFQIRLFPNHQDLKFEGRIHEQVIFSLSRLKIREVYTTLKIIHRGYEDRSKLGEKLTRNLKLLLKEEEENPSFWVKRYIAVSLFRLQRLEEAAKKIQEAYELVPRTSIHWMFDILITKADIEKARGNWEGFFEAMIESEKIRPDEGMINLKKAEYYYVKGEYEKSLEEIDKAKGKGFLVGIIPISPEQLKRMYWLSRARVLFKLERYSEAKDAFIELKNISKDLFTWNPTLEEFIDCMFSLKEYKIVYDVLKELEDKIPPHQFSNLAISAERCGNIEDAEKYYRRAYEKTQNNPDVIFNFAHFQFMQGNFKEALNLFLEYLKLVEYSDGLLTDILSALVCVGNILLRSGDLKSSVDVLSTAYELSGNVSFAEDVQDLAYSWGQISDKFKSDYMRLITLENAIMTLKFAENNQKTERVYEWVTSKINDIKSKSINLQNGNI